MNREGRNLVQLQLQNREAVTHHFSHNREAEKEMGSVSKTEKTQEILGQAMAHNVVPQEGKIVSGPLLPLCQL